MTRTNRTVSRINRHRRIRAVVVGSASRPRVAVFRSARHTYAQAVDDASRRTLASASATGVKGKKSASEAMRENAGAKELSSFALGQALGAKLKELGITTVVFDRGGFQYHGRVKAVAEGLRQAGITV